MKFNDIINLLIKDIRMKPQENWDNSGLQIGNLNSDIKNVMITLDLDKEAVRAAIENKTDLIITHHPFIFNPIKSIDFNTYDGEIIKDLIKNNINLYSMHTSFDMAEYGVNHVLAKKLGIETFDVLHNINDSLNNPYGYGGVSDIKKTNIVKYAEFVKDALNCKNLKLYCNDRNKIIARVAFCGGSGSEFIQDAIKNKADVYITGDIKYHQAQDALKNDLLIIDAGHFYTEFHSLDNIKTSLEKISNLNIIMLNKNTVEEILI
nr:Nif3-like dinuclear metal center hexameric protein [Sedimentibacter sp.]